MECARFIFLCIVVMVAPAQNLYSNHPAVESVTRLNNFTLFEKNGKVGLKDEGGQVLIPAMYDAIGWSDGTLSIIDKVVGYEIDGLWGLIHTSNKVITPAQFLDLKPGEGLFVVAQKKSRLSLRPSFGVIGTSGKTVIPFQYDGLQLSNRRAIVMSRSGTKFLFGLVDLSDKILIPLAYQAIHSLGTLRFAVKNFEDKTAIFTDAGNRITNFTIDSISAFRKGYAIIYQNQRAGLIDRNGRIVLQPGYGAIKMNDNGTIQVRETDSWFFLDGQNNLNRQFQADAVKSLSPDHYAVTSGGKLQLTNNNLTPMHDGFFASVTDFRNGIALYRKAGRTGAIADNGKIVIPAEYQKLIIDQNGFLACLGTGYKNQWAILDGKGNQITQKHYEEILPFNGSFYPVRNRGYWGAVNENGKEIITCVHDSLIQYKGNHVVVKFKGQYGIVNLDENWIVTPQQNPLALLDHRLYFEFDGKTTFLKSLTGNIIYFSDNPLEYDDEIIRERLLSGAYWTIDKNGIVIDRSKQPADVERVYPESEGLRAILKDGKFGFIDSAGRLRVANRYEAVQPFSGGLAAIRIMNKWGFIDRHEKLVVQPVYDRVENFKGDLTVVTQDNLSGLIDLDGNVILPLRYDQIMRNRHDRFTLRQGNSSGLANASGTVVIHPNYDRIEDTSNGYVIIERNGKFGLLTLGGVSTIPMIYDGLIFDPHHNQFMAVKKSTWKTLKSPKSAGPP